MLLLALLIGVVAGLRTMIAPAAIACAAAQGGLALQGSWLAFMGWRFTPWVFSLLALGELVADKLPSTPSRRVPIQFGARLVSGGVCGAAVGYGLGAPIAGCALGILGAALGTLGGAAVRAKLTKGFGRDRPAALIEDIVAIAGAILVFAALR